MPEILAEVEESIDITAHVAATPGSLTDDYNDLQNHPSINGVELVGNKTTADLNIEPLPGSITPEMFAPDTQDEMVVGLAQNLLARTGTTNTSPYLFRKSPNNVSAELHRLTGCTVAWNQLFPDATFTSTVTDTRTYISFMYRLNASPWTSFLSKTFTTTGIKDYVFKATATGTAQLIHSGSANNLIFENNISVTNDHVYYLTANFTGVDLASVGGVKTKDMMLIDLTQMFGSTIADAILAMETATAGSGVAFFRSLFPSAYYPYSAPTLQSVQTSARVARGFNQWDEEWVNGYYDATTGNLVQSASAATLACRNHIPVIPGGTYYLNVNHVGTGTLYYALFEYGADGTFLKRTDIPATFTVSTGTTSIAFHIANYGNGYYGHDICLNISGSRNGQYEPYEAKTYPIDDIVLRGIPKLTNGVLSYDGDIYLPTGEVTRKYAEVADLNEKSYTLMSYTGRSVFYTGLSGAKNKVSGVINNAICEKYTAENVTGAANLSDKCFLIISSNLYIRDDAYNDATAFKASLSNVGIVYELATPTTESADPYTEIQSAGETEQFESESVVPVGNEAFYAEDLTGVVQNLAPLPTTAGTYKLQVTVSGGVPSYSWVSG